MHGPSLLTFAQTPVGLAWQSIAIDRSQATGLAFNLNTISRGGGGDTPVATRWSAKQGPGPEAAAMNDGLICNSVGNISWRALQYSIPLRSLAAGAGNVSRFCDTVILEALIYATAPGNQTGVFLTQTNGDIPSTAWWPAPGIGFGFRPNGIGVDCWASNLGSVGMAPAGLSATSLRRCTLTVRSARAGQAGRVEWAVDGQRIASAALDAAVSNGPNQGYSVGRSTYWPIVSADAGTLYVADFSIINIQPGEL